ncbi:MAG: hypothetical protein MUF87_08455 [Anaerolineae bacterium]|nr:hypothetical protein [Anaerolineae bacterium]
MSDPQCIVQLIARVTQVSLETMRLIGKLPELSCRSAPQKRMAEGIRVN